jgi:hypothetical protein
MKLQEVKKSNVLTQCQKNNKNGNNITKQKSQKRQKQRA